MVRLCVIISIAFFSIMSKLGVSRSFDILHAIASEEKLGMAPLPLKVRSLAKDSDRACPP